MFNLVMMIGIPGSGKTTRCKEVYPNYLRVSQDDQGKENHKELFKQAIEKGMDVVVDRCNLTKFQRKYYYNLAIKNGYKTKADIFICNPSIAKQRIIDRKDHPTLTADDDLDKILVNACLKLSVPILEEKYDEQEVFDEDGKEVDPLLLTVKDTPEINVRQGYLDDGLLSKSETEDLILYNYTDKCVFEQEWDHITLHSRGHIFEKATDKVVALPFDKFFNLNEHSSSREDKLPNLPYYIAEKVDGSLGIIFNYKGKWQVATRGSFYSEQAKKANQMLSSYDMSKIDPKHTLLVEIVYPENRIVVDYKETSELVLLSVRNREDGYYFTIDGIRTVAKLCGMRPVKIYENLEFKEAVEKAKTELSWQDEGYVVVYQNGFRVKVKSEEYMRIARVKNHLGPLSVWEAFASGKVIEYLAEIPYEIKEEADLIFSTLLSQAMAVKAAMAEWANKLNVHMLEREDRENAKEMANRIKTAPKFFQMMLFSMMRGQDHMPIIFDKIRPDNNKYVVLNLEKP